MRIPVHPVWLVSAICVFVSSCLSGCRTTRPSLPPPSGMLFGGGLPPPALIIPPVRAAPLKRPPPFDLGALDVDEFIPLGASVIGPYGQVGAALVEEVRMRHPTAELSPSPDGEAVIFNDGYKAKTKIVHWLTLKRRDSAVPNSILSTMASYDTMWSPKSDAFAVTHYVGGNTTEVFIIPLGDLERVDVLLKPIVATYFPARFAPLPIFAKAYRWTRNGELVVRGVAQTTEPPFERIGCELKIDVHDTEGNRVTFLRGYVQGLEN